MSGGAPDWAAQLDAAAFERFMVVVNDALRPLGGTAAPDGFAEIAGSQARYGLANLAQQWALAEPASRDDLVRSHFQRLLGVLAQPRRVGPELLPLLRPRIWHTPEIEDTGVPVVSKALAPGLTAVVTIDLPEAVTSLRPDEAAVTGQTIEQLWEIAFRQIEDGQPVETFEMVSGVSVTSGNSLFVASRMLDPPRFTDQLGAYGALLAIPNRHVLIAHAINDASTRAAVNAIVPTARDLWRDGPGSITPDLYWWRQDEQLITLPVTREEPITLAAPAQFVALLERLSA